MPSFVPPADLDPALKAFLEHQFLRFEEHSKKRERDFELQIASLQGENKALKESSASSAAKPASMDQHKLRPEPPAPDIQAALQEACAKEEAAFQSPQELALLASQPAPDAPPDVQMFFRMQLLQVKQQFPPPTVFPFKKGTIILSKKQLFNVFPPVGLGSWLEHVLPRHFNYGKGLSPEEISRLHGTPAQVEIGTGTGITFTSSGAKTKLPEQITSFDDYSRCTDLLSQFMVASNRWNQAEAELHRTHTRLVADWFGTYPVKDIMRYDGQVRFKNHSCRTSVWSLDAALKSEYLDVKAANTVAAAASGSKGTTSNGDTAALVAQLKQALKTNKNGPKKQPDTKKDEEYRAFVSRPWNKVKKKGNQGVCHRFNWNVAPCRGKTCNAKTKTKLLHICSFCGDADHQVVDCDEYKTQHPDDLKLGSVFQ